MGACRMRRRTFVIIATAIAILMLIVITLWSRSISTLRHERARSQQMQVMAALDSLEQSLDAPSENRYTTHSGHHGSGLDWIMKWRIEMHRTTASGWHTEPLVLIEIHRNSQQKVLVVTTFQEASQNGKAVDALKALASEWGWTVRVHPSPEELPEEWPHTINPALNERA